MSNLPNTTQVPNIIFNGLMAKMSDTELRIVLAVTRKTLGWLLDKSTGMRKKEDWLSQAQLKQITGRTSRALSNAVNNCIKQGWIETRDENGNLLTTKEERKGKKLYFRLGSKILLTTSLKSKDDKNKPLYKVKFKKESLKSKVDKTNIYKTNRIQKKALVKRKRKYGSIKNILEEDLVEIAQMYKVPLAFVKLQLETLRNYCESKGKKYKNYKAALRNFVINEAKRQMERRHNDSKSGIDARDI